MNTNSIQPTEGSKDLSACEASSLLPFERGFLVATKTTGVWPIALTFSFVATGLLMGGIEVGNFGLKAIGIFGFVGVTSSLITMSVWILLSRFRWPIFLRLVLSLWTPILAAVIILQPYFSLVNWANFLKDPVAQMFIMPSIVGGFIALFPYFYREYLISRTVDSANLIELSKEPKLIQ